MYLCVYLSSPDVVGYDSVADADVSNLSFTSKAATDNVSVHSSARNFFFPVKLNRDMICLSAVCYRARDPGT